MTKEDLEDCPARSKAIGSEPILAGVRAFESHLSHSFLINLICA